MPRDDLTKHLVHWTKGADYDEAFQRLRQIVSEKILRGSENNIRGGWECVCFTEAPETHFHQVIGKYRPFGIQVPKSWLFELGGRPVIYESNGEYDHLPEKIQWRHMRYEPNIEPPFDFSWEREWRIQIDQLPLDPRCTRILVPDESWLKSLINEHQDNEYMQLQFMASAYGDEWLAYPIEEFAFKCSVIDV